MKKLLFCVLFSLIFFKVSYTQTAEIDSLFSVLDTVQTDSSLIDLSDALGEAFFNSCMIDSAEVYAQKALDLAQTKNYEHRAAEAKHLLAYILYDQKRDEEAFFCLTEAKDYYEKAKKKYNKYWMHYYLGGIYEAKGEVPKALLHYDSAGIFTDKEDTLQIFDLNLRLASLFWYQKDYEKAKKYYFKNITLTQTARDTYLLYAAYANLGTMYNDDGQSDSAILYLELALPVIKPVDSDWAACMEGCLGTNYKNLGDCKTALKYYESSLEQSENYEDSEECLSFVEIAYCYLKLGNFEKAAHFNDLAVGSIHKMKDKKLKRDAFIELVRLYKEKGDFEGALSNFEKLKIFEDSMFRAENRKAIEEFEIKYKTREQQSQLEFQILKLSKQRTLILGGILLLTFLALLIFLAFRNILHKKKANDLLAERNQHLEELDLTKARFFSNISHELRTPLTLVTAPLEKMIEKVREKDLKDDLKLIHGNSQKLLVLVNEILDLSKLESGQMKLKLSKIEMEETLRRVFFSFQSFAEIRKIKLDYIGNLPEKIWVKADTAKLEKILNNLVSNAVKYSDSKGKVTLSVSCSEVDSRNQFIIKVTDTGKGIREEDIPKIFNRFFQSNSDQLTGGTGIGLALTKELVHLFGGELSVQSIVGEGSTFTVKLPLELSEMPIELNDNRQIFESEEDESTNENSESKNYNPISVDGQKPKILIVEDNLEMSRFLVKTLSEFYECEPAYDGIEALQKLEKEHFDIISSDVMMPGMDGFEFLERVRQNGTIFQNTPFIMLTARSPEADKLEGFRLGTDDYVTKPFSTKELTARIDNLLKNKRLRDFSKSSQKEEIIESEDRKILKEAEQIVLENLSDTSFGVGQLAMALALSQRSLNRQINCLTGMSPVGFIREIRLQKAMQMLQRRHFLRVSEICLEVGIDNPSYFNRKFKERFGITPKAVLGKVGSASVSV